MNFRETVVQAKRAEIYQRVRSAPVERLQEREMYHWSRRSLETALRAREFAVIAEVKRASPSRGVLRVDFDPARIGRQYEQGGAAAVSVLTDEKFFGGHLEHLSVLRSTIDLPLLRKDFIVDGYQLHEARSAGADAVLLIVALLDPSTLAALSAEAAGLGLETLVEVHNEEELRTAADMGARMIGVNNRDLRSLKVNVETSLRLGPKLPSDCVGISESGIQSGEDLLRLRMAGFGAALVGESLMRREDPGRGLRDLLDDYARRTP